MKKGQTIPDSPCFCMRNQHVQPFLNRMLKGLASMYKVMALKLHVSLIFLKFQSVNFRPSYEICENSLSLVNSIS